MKSNLNKFVSNKDLVDIRKQINLFVKENKNTKYSHKLITEDETEDLPAETNGEEEALPDFIKDNPGAESAKPLANIDLGGGELEGDQPSLSGDDTNVGIESIDVESPVELNSMIVDMINERIGDEYLAHYFYTCASNWCEEVGYSNAGKFFSSEADNELIHAKKLQKYLLDWNIIPKIPKVETTHEVKSLVDCVNKAYKIEYDLYQKYDEISRHISQLDLATFDFLSEFRLIQKDSVAEFANLLSKLKLIDTTDKLSLIVFEQHNFGE